MSIKQYMPAYFVPSPSLSRDLSMPNSTCIVDIERWTIFAFETSNPSIWSPKEVFELFLCGQAHAILRPAIAIQVGTKPSRVRG